MITEVPTQSDFEAAGLNQLYLAWQIAMQAIEDYEEVEDTVDLVDYADETDQRSDATEQDIDEPYEPSASDEYWAKSQPALANAFGLIQQAMEMALKGRIASISPFLLISRDPKDWPRGVDVGAVPFSEFRTLDAADLVKVHNTFARVPLDEDFRAFWDKVRRDRNKIMHSVSAVSFDPATLVRTMLTAAQALFAEVPWPQRLLDMEAEGKYAAYGLDDSTQNVVLRQIDIAVRHLSPAENRALLGYDVKRRSYLCPNCYGRANRDYQETWPQLAQLLSKSRDERTLHCIVCDDTVEVERLSCTNPDCPGDVIHDAMCLTCVSSQDNPGNFCSGLEIEVLGHGHRYWLRYARGALHTSETKQFPNDEAAREHGHRSMLELHLTSWETVTIHHEEMGRHSFGRLLGTWVRRSSELIWEAGHAPDAIV
jgi:hypothetical protein